MKVTHIEIIDFRQYHNTVSVDLETTESKNIVIIGGLNGFGKSNFLLAIVWCLYGDRISLIDENFRKEIQKEKNYSAFMLQSLNMTAKKENKTKFSVSISIAGIEMPQAKTLSSYEDSVVIKRTFDVESMNEDLTIFDLSSNMELFNDDADKINFINDYVIPIDAAKFVFFDAEKIAEIANLSIKDEGNFINDALGKILGLDVYENLIDDFETYINSLKKEGASKNLQEQIISIERECELALLEINNYEEENAEKLKEIDQCKKLIRDYEESIIRHSKRGNKPIDRSRVVEDINILKDRQSELTERFNDLNEIIPLVILTGKLEEVRELLDKQEKKDLTEISFKENSSKIEDFIERLFNKPPEPENSTLSLRDKMFYFEKAQRLSIDLFNTNEQPVDLFFEHDLNNFEKKLIHDAIRFVNTQSKDLFESTIEDYNQINLEIANLNNTLSKIDADLEDELILEYSGKKRGAEYKIEALNRKFGENDEKIKRLRNDITRNKQSLANLVRKVDINERNKQKISKSNQYVKALNFFLEEQKTQHKIGLEKAILSELRLILHKLNSDTNRAKFIEDVKVSILAGGQGMKVSMFDQNDNEIRKESLSSGEKQIYISCLIKAILKESIKKLPIFIDTPLGRLDEEHRDAITKKYYPRLSEQVVLFSTNSEITPTRFKDISENIAKSYFLESDGTNTKVKSGYFNSMNDD